MKFTVDTRKNTIVIHGSYKYEDFLKFVNELPYQWKDFTFEAEKEKEYIYPPIYYTAPTYTGCPVPTDVYKVTCKATDTQIPLFPEGH